MRGSPDVGAAQRFGVAAEAVVQDLFGFQLGKGHNSGFSTARFYVGLARAVAALASGALGRFFSGGDALVMRVLVEVRPNIGMAGPAHVAAHESGSRGGRLSLQKNGEEKKGEEA
jgi:hypothetical protein